MRSPTLAVLLLAALLPITARYASGSDDYAAASRAGRWQSAVDAFTQEDKSNPPPSGVIVFAGSSSIAGWKTLSADFPELPLINRGIGGFWLADLTYFAEPLVLKHPLTTVVVYAGENDLADGRSVESVVDAFARFDKALRLAHPEAKLVFISLKPSPSRVALLGKFAEVNRHIQAQCAASANRAFVDVYSPMLDAAGLPRNELFVSDGLHMNEAGYQLWAKLLRAALIAPIESAPRTGMLIRFR